MDEFFSLHDRDFDGKLSINDLTGKVQELFQMCDKDMFCQDFFEGSPNGGSFQINGQRRRRVCDERGDIR